MTLIETKARKISSEMNSKDFSGHVSTLDPATILLIVQIIIQVIRMFMDCRKKPESAIDIIKNPGRLDTIKLRVAMINVLGLKHPLQNIKVRKAIEDMGKTLTLSELTQMYSEAK